MIRKMLGWAPGVLMVCSLTLGIYQSIAIAGCQQGDCADIGAWGSQVNGSNSCIAYYLDKKCMMPTTNCIQCGGKVVCLNQNNDVCEESIEIYIANCVGANCSLQCPAPIKATTDQQATCTNPQVNTASDTVGYDCTPRNSASGI